MVLNYLGVQASYRQLVALFDTKVFGTAFRHIQRLETLGVSVAIADLYIPDIVGYLQIGLPVIACVNTADLDSWRQAVDHVLVVVGSDSGFLYVNDPAFEHGQQPIPHAKFALAQLEFDHLCAVVS